jgi:membrane protein DedA with SNARE-associated domain/rhodanese-related sulfurtransferase
MSHSAIAQFTQFVEHYGYALLFFWVLAEQGALPIPSVPLLVAAGALVRTGRLNGALAIACCAAGALIADSVWFRLGRRRGKRVLRFLCRVSLEPDSCVNQTENAFLKYGLNMLLVAKFVPGLNAVAAPLAGDSGVAVVRFLALDTAGIVLWSGAYMAVGYIFSEQLELVLAHIQRLGSGLMVLMVGLFAAWILWKYFQRRRFLKQIEMARITPEELRERMDQGEDLFIVDVRKGLTSDSRTLPGAVRLSAEDLTVNWQQVPRDREIISLLHLTERSLQRPCGAALKVPWHHASTPVARGGGGVGEDDAGAALIVATVMAAILRPRSRLPTAAAFPAAANAVCSRRSR